MPRPQTEAEKRKRKYYEEKELIRKQRQQEQIAKEKAEKLKQTPKQIEATETALRFSPLSVRKAKKEEIATEPLDTISKLKNIQIQNPKRFEEIATEEQKAIIEAERRAKFQKESGAGELQKEVEQKIFENPNLEPEPIMESTQKLIETGAEKIGITELSELPQFATKLLNGKATKEDIDRQIKGGVKRLIAGGAIAGTILAYPAIMTTFTKTAIGNFVLGKGSGSTIIKVTVEGLGLYLIGGKIFDYNGGEMQTLRSGFEKITTDGERLEALARQGYSTTDAITLLRTMENEISTAESRIKELGNYNIQYRVSKEYIQDQINARSAREAILRRIIAIENLAARGETVLDPENLLFELSQLK